MVAPELLVHVCAADPLQTASVSGCMAPLDCTHMALSTFGKLKWIGPVCATPGTIHPVWRSGSDESQFQILMREEL